MNSDRSGNDEVVDKEHPFQLVEFVNEKRCGKYDLVPKHWLSFDIGTGKLVTKFLNPPYNNDSCRLLHSLVESLADPPESWPKYEIILKGRAETYSDAVRRVEVLNSKPYAYTTDSDIPPAKRAESELKKYQTQALRANETLLKTVMEVPKLGKSTKKSIYDEVYSESEHNGDAKQSLSSDGSIEKNQFRRSMKISKFKGSVRRIVNSQKKKEKSVRPLNRLQVIESDDSDDVDFPDIPIVTRQSLPTSSTSKGSSSSQYNFFRPSYNTTNSSDSAPSPPPANEAENPTDKRDDAVKTKGTDDVHLKCPPTQKSGTARPTNNPAEKRGDARKEKNNRGDIHSQRFSVAESEESDHSGYRRAMLNKDENVSNGAKEAILEVDSDNPPDDRDPRQKLPKETRVLLKAIKALAIDVRQCTSAVENMQAMIERSKIVRDIVRDGRSFVEKYNVQIPFQSVDEFKLFDQMLKDNAECRNDLAASLQLLVNPDNNPGRTVTAVLKKYMTRDLALKFTAVKDSLTKSAFKDMNFCSCLLDLVVQVHTDKDGAPIGEKTFYKVLGASFANAEDWDGHRAHGPRR